MYKGTTRAPVTIIIFAIISCGIYYLYWMWQVKKDINGLLGREEISTGLWIAGLFIPLIWLYLWYKIDLGLKNEICKQKGVTYGDNNFIIWLVCALVAGVGSFIAMFQIQEALNAVWAAPDAPQA
jgi:hypothetical protein